MNTMVRAEAVYAQLEVPDSSALFDLVGADLCRSGFVRETFAQALTQREANFPTGLPVSGGVAIPHTDAEHVLVDIIAVVTLRNPIRFWVMAGGEDDVIEVSTVFVLALSDPDQHVTLLPRIVKLIQDEAFIGSLHEATGAAMIAELANRALAGG